MIDKLRVEVVAVNGDASLEDIQNTVGGHRLEYVIDLDIKNMSYLEDVILYFMKGKLPVHFNVSATVETLDKEFTDAIEVITTKISEDIPSREDLKCVPNGFSDEALEKMREDLFTEEGGICKNKVC